MSDERDARREAGSGRFNDAIDRAVREMLDVEPPPGLRGRVMDRLDAADGTVASAFRRKNRFAWFAAPVAAAAMILLAVTSPWRNAAPPAPTAPPVVATLEPRAVPPPPVAPEAAAPTTTVPKTPRAPKITSLDAARITAPRPVRLVEAAAVAVIEDVTFTAVDVLAGPEAISVDRIAEPPATALRSIEPTPLQIRPIEITALLETPQQRREE